MPHRLAGLETSGTGFLPARREVGPLLLKSLIAQDMFLAGTIILLIGIMTVIGTFLSDLLLAWIDPRIRLEGT